MKEHIRYISDDVIEIESNETWLEHILIDKILTPILVVMTWIIVIPKLFVWFCIDEMRSKKHKEPSKQSCDMANDID